MALAPESHRAGDQPGLRVVRAGRVPAPHGQEPQIQSSREACAAWIHRQGGGKTVAIGVVRSGGAERSLEPGSQTLANRLRPSEAPAQMAAAATSTPNPIAGPTGWPSPDGDLGCTARANGAQPRMRVLERHHPQSRTKATNRSACRNAVLKPKAPSREQARSTRG